MCGARNTLGLAPGKWSLDIWATLLFFLLSSTLDHPHSSRFAFRSVNILLLKGQMIPGFLCLLNCLMSRCFANLIALSRSNLSLAKISSYHSGHWFEFPFIVGRQLARLRPRLDMERANLVLPCRRLARDALEPWTDDGVYFDTFPILAC